VLLDAEKPRAGRLESRTGSKKKYSGDAGGVVLLGGMGLPARVGGRQTLTYTFSS